MKESKKAKSQIYDISRHFHKICEGGRYNVISCINLVFHEIFTQFLKTSKESDSFELPTFSKEAVIWIHNNPPQIPTREISNYVDTMFAAAKMVFGSAFKYSFSLDTPLTIHTRWPYLPLEIGIAWHPLLNIPYIPATSLKGAFRASSPPNLCGLKKEDIFGTTEKEGAVIFFDAYLTALAKGKPIEPDILTPHYREAEGEISEIQAKPTPLVFPVVPPGATFTFVVAVKRQEIPHNCEIELHNAFKEVLSKGLGAKTTVGYGVFRIR